MSVAAPASPGNSAGGGGNTNSTIVAPIGQKTSNNSVSVVIASDQTPVPVSGNISVSPASSNNGSSPTQATINTGSALALAANNNRVGSPGVQNQGTTVLYVVFGTASASANTCHFQLPAGGSTNDGSSLPQFGPPQLSYKGPVQWASSNNGGLGTASEW